MRCPATPVPVTIVAQHGPDMVGVLALMTTGATKPSRPSAQMTGVVSGPSKSKRTPSTPTTSTWRRVRPEGSTDDILAGIAAPGQPPPRQSAPDFPPPHEPQR